MIMNGRFGTIVTNEYDNIISKISNNLEKVYNCRFRKGIQVYFPAEQKIVVWYQDSEIATVLHAFKGTCANGLVNFSKLV